jgi:uncharacterized SAM-binding protein YcdF (DUF218 family)
MRRGSGCILAPEGQSLQAVSAPPPVAAALGSRYQGKMFFGLSKILWWFVSPGNVLLALLCLGAILLLTPWRRAGRRICVLAALLFVLVATVPVGGWMITALENRFPQPRSLPERIDGVISLGGMVDPVVSEARGQIAVSDAVERLTALSGLARRHPEARLIFSGGAGSIRFPDLREADFLGPFLDDIGLDPNRVILDNRARNTAENAEIVKKLAAPKPGETWVLVTSAFHMPRAVGCFRQAGFPVVPYPVDFHTVGEFGFTPIPALSGNLSALELAVHEWLGLVFYRLTGRTGELFPAPGDLNLRND